MRNKGSAVILTLVSLLAAVVLLPMLGVLFLIVAGIVVLLIVAFLAAPLLMKLPWFRKRIIVERYGTQKIIRFGRGFEQEPSPQQNDVLDAQFRELPDEDDKS